MLTAIMPDEIHIHFLLTFCLFLFCRSDNMAFLFLLFLFFFIVITPYLISISYHCFNLLSCTSKMFSDLSNVIIHATITAIIIIAPYPDQKPFSCYGFVFFCSRAASVTMQTPSAQVLFPENPQEPCTPMASYVSCHRPALRFC